MNHQDTFLHILSYLSPLPYYPKLASLSNYHYRIIEDIAYQEFLKCILFERKWASESVEDQHDSTAALHQKILDVWNRQGTQKAVMQDSDEMRADDSPMHKRRKGNDGESFSESENTAHAEIPSLKQIAFSLSRFNSVFSSSSLDNHTTLYYSKIGQKNDFDCYTLLFHDFHLEPNCLEIRIAFDAYHSWSRASKFVFPQDKMTKRIKMDPVLSDALKQIGREGHGQVVWDLTNPDLILNRNSLLLPMDWGHFNRWKNRYESPVNRRGNVWELAFTMYGDKNSPMVVLHGEDQTSEKPNKTESNSANGAAELPPAPGAAILPPLPTGRTAAAASSAHLSGTAILLPEPQVVRRTQNQEATRDLQQMEQEAIDILLNTFQK